MTAPLDLLALVDRAERGALLPAEAVILRAGIVELQRDLGVATAGWVNANRALQSAIRKPAGAVVR